MKIYMRPSSIFPFKSQFWGIWYLSNKLHYTYISYYPKYFVLIVLSEFVNCYLVAIWTFENKLLLLYCYCIDWLARKSFGAVFPSFSASLFWIDERCVALLLFSIEHRWACISELWMVIGKKSYDFFGIRLIL